ncbi:hypothetical protein, partial [Salmonella enterica]|uniref:hypothetical protein n=1 Tax=Salmonella enterica TaxID=28901 RepID=UPI0035248EEC
MAALTALIKHNNLECNHPEAAQFLRTRLKKANEELAEQSGSGKMTAREASSFVTWEEVQA